MSARGLGRARGAASAVLFCLAVLMGSCAGLLVGCRPSRPAGFPPGVPAHPESLQVALAARPAPGGIEGRGLLRLEVGTRRLPTLNLRFSARRGIEGRALLRPGILSPVLSLWAGSDGWSVLLPRERVAFEAAAIEQVPELAARNGTACLPSGLPGRMAWYLFVPKDLAVSLENPGLISHGSDWILRGKPRDLGETVALAEVWVDQETLAISRWSLILPTGESLLRVAFDRPLTHARVGARVSFVVPSLDLRGWLRVTEADEKELPARPRPLVPDGWERFPAESLPRYLEALLVEDN